MIETSSVSDADIFIVDLFLGEGSGFDLISLIRQHIPQSRILVCSMQDKELVSDHVYQCGADGFLSKRDIPTNLIEAIHTLFRGEPYLDRNILKNKIMQSYHLRQLTPPTKIKELTTREFEIFNKIGMGEDTDTIARSLHIDVDEVQTICHAIQSKLNLNSKDDLIKHSMKWVYS